MAVNPLIEAIHEQRIERPDSIKSTFKRDWHPIAQSIAMLGALLSQKGHRWNKGEKKLYRRAILSVQHPCCPTCGKPMNESAVTVGAKVHKSWYCEAHQNL